MAHARDLAQSQEGVAAFVSQHLAKVKPCQRGHHVDGGYLDTQKARPTLRQDPKAGMIPQ